MNTLTLKLIQATKAKVKRITGNIQIDHDERAYAVIRITKGQRQYRIACTQADGSRLMVEEAANGALSMNGSTNYIHDSVKPYLRNSLMDIQPS